MVSVCQVKSRQVKFVCIVQYPIQCLSGLYRLTATTAQSQSFRRDKEIKKAKKTPKTVSTQKIETAWEEIRKDILSSLLGVSNNLRCVNDGARHGL